MIVACPSCQVRFNLDPAKLLPAGRNVRCAKCGYGWRQMPEGMEAAPQPAPAPPPPAPEPVAEPIAEPAPPPPEEAEPDQPRPPETPAEMAQSLAAIAEQVAGAAKGGEGYTVREGAPQIPENPIARLARRGPARGPITVPPRMRPMRPAKRSSHFGLILGAGLVIGLLVAAYVFRDVIARTVPGADMVYALLHLSTDNAAADLEISIDHTGMRKDDTTGKQVFEVRATIFNLSDSPVEMPPLVIVPVDDAGSQLEPLRFRLHEDVVQPGQNIKFQKSFDNWPSTAPNFVLGVADAP